MPTDKHLEASAWRQPSFLGFVHMLAVPAQSCRELRSNVDLIRKKQHIPSQTDGSTAEIVISHSLSRENRRERSFAKWVPPLFGGPMREKYIGQSISYTTMYIMEYSTQSIIMHIASN